MHISKETHGRHGSNMKNLCIQAMICYTDPNKSGLETRMGGAERRREPRYTIKQMVAVSYAHEEFIAAHGLDLSSGGISCRTTSPLDVGQEIFLLLGLGKDETMSCGGVVLHVAPEGSGYKAGIQFVNLSAEDRARLDAHLGTLKG